MSNALEAAAREIVIEAIEAGAYTLGPSLAKGIARAAITAYLRAVADDPRSIEYVARSICARVEIGEFKDPDKMSRVGEGNGDFEPIWTTHIEAAEAAVAALRAALEPKE